MSEVEAGHWAGDARLVEGAASARMAEEYEAAMEAEGISKYRREHIHDAVEQERKKERTTHASAPMPKPVGDNKASRCSRCPRCESAMLMLWRVHGVGEADSGRCLNCLARLGVSDGVIAMIEEPEILEVGGR